jgi:copper chaperone NosL
MKRVLIFYIYTALLFACTVKPEPIRYGTDMCHACKMTLMDRKYGGEVVTRKGKIYKFDDINCMVNFLNSGYLEDREISHRLVTDYAQPGTLIDATQAFYLKSEEIRSPMAGHLAAFRSEEMMETHKKQLNAIYLTWGEVVTQFK